MTDAAAPRVGNGSCAPEVPDMVAPTTRGGRVLVLEDEPLLALDMAQALEEAGYAVIGPVRTLSDAMRLLDEVGCDAAVVDVNLGSTTSAPLASELRNRSIPFAAVTGYSDLPPEFDGAARLSKPIDYPVVLAAVKRMLPGHG